MAMLLAGGCGSSSGNSPKIQPASVRVVNDANLVSGCQVLGTVADNEFEDLQSSRTFKRRRLAWAATSLS
jgi:hypothetical protein